MIITCSNCNAEIDITKTITDICSRCNHNLRTHEVYLFNKELSSKIQEYQDVNTTLISTLFYKDKQYINVFIQMIDLRDDYTGKHSQRVAKISAVIGRMIDVKLSDIAALVRCAQVHDIGKVYVPDSILRKKGALTSEEYEIVKKHTVKGSFLIEKVESLKPAFYVVRNHHEHWNGSGYPDGLKGTETHQWARIIGIADAIDSMAVNRIYRQVMTKEEIEAELRDCAGVQFDPHIVDILLSTGGIDKIFEEIFSE